MNFQGKFRLKRISWEFIATVLLLHFPIYENRNIEGFKYPVFTTEFCPRNKTELDERSSALNCTGENSYACFPNDELTELWEFCYPLPRISIPKNLCLYLSNTRQDLDSFDCINFISGCPKFPYSASTIYEYPMCVSIANGCFLAEPSCESTSAPIVLESNTEQRNSNEVNDKKDLFWISLGTYLGIAIIVFISYYCWISSARKDENGVNNADSKNCDLEEIIKDENGVNNADSKDFDPEEEENGVNNAESKDFDPEEIIKDENGVNNAESREFDREKARASMDSKLLYGDMLGTEIRDLYNACKTGNYKAVCDLLKTDVCVNSCLSDGRSPLHAACEHGHNSIVNYLLENGADITAKDSDSPLHVACRNGRDNIVQLLLKKGANVNLSGLYGVTPLFSACENGRESTVKLLLDNKAEINICNNYGTSPLHTSCENAHKCIVELLLSNGADVNLVSWIGRSPLSAACFKGFENIVQLLLNNNADVNLCSLDGSSPLFLACRRGHYQIAKLLLHKGADSELYRNDGCSPLKIAQRKGQNKIVELLLDHSTNVN